MSATPASELAEDRIRAMVETNAYAEFKGPTVASRPLITEDGWTWVEVSVPYGQARAFDVFDITGRRVDRVRLPKGRRLIAIGRSVLYLVAVDEDGLERVERYPMR